MRIANPIYDVVFKYLMEDKKSATLLLSKLIDKEIVELDFHPQERTVQIPQKMTLTVERESLTVRRMDFAAKIKTKTGELKKVIIEIQKAKFPTDIMRFRQYLGKQYISQDNVYYDENDDKKALPIINIYFLGHKLENIDRALIKVNRDYYDGITGEKLSHKEEFIECLSHDSIVVQIPALKQPYKTELELLLSLFDQAKKVSDHVLNVNEKQFPEEYKVVIRRLVSAAADQEVVETMELEDEILEELENKDRKLEKKDRTIEEKDKTIEENKKALEKKDKALEEQAKIIAQLQRKLEKS